MPKMKAGTLKPAIDQLKKSIEEKGESLTPAQLRQMKHRLRRMQRKASRIRTLEAARTAATAPPAPKEEAAGDAAPTEAEAS